MTSADWIPILPLIILVVGTLIVLMMAPLLKANRTTMAQIATFACAISAYCLSNQWSGPYGASFHGMFVVDRYSLFFQWIFLVITASSVIISIRFNERESIRRGEYYALLLLACCGMLLLAASADLVLTFLGIEVLSISTYVLVGIQRNDARSNEASLKYFLLGSFATAFLLYGIALLYGTTGVTRYGAIHDYVLEHAGNLPTLQAGLGLLIVGFGFKLALVPFHAWAPDVYEGAPTPVTAFMTIGPKAAGFAALVRILFQALPSLDTHWVSILWVISILTMTVGNVVAVRQKNIKRMLAYSAIAHAGYILIGIVAHSRIGLDAVLFYIVVYTVMNLGAFTIILSLSRPGDRHLTLEEYAGLARRAPFPAAALSVFLISLAGIPLTGGFIGKVYLFGAAIREGLIALAVVGVLNSVVSVFYYFRFIVAMYMKESEKERPIPSAMSIPLFAICLIALVGVFWLGIFPRFFHDLAGSSTLFSL